MTASKIMSPELAAIQGGTGLEDAIEYMKDRGARRLPVVDERGALVGKEAGRGSRA